MKMHEMRVWQKRDYRLFFWMMATAAICYLSHFYVGMFLLYLAATLYVGAVVLVFYGVGKRNTIKQGYYREAKQMGLERTFVIPYNESNDEIWFEIHLMEPVQKQRSTPVRLLRQYIRDLRRLYDFAKTYQKKRVVYVGTTHQTLTIAAMKEAIRLGLVYEIAPIIHDQSAPMTKREWRGVLRKMYGDDQNIRAPAKGEWRTLIVRVENP
ncbi:hypothetical protein [Brevibacillus sp. FSL K6-2834]|uniref:hypothetical protein n=1 Tax=Brevibacillus sp. FSL K6-2834 TaxID=2954680 RepID=UPI003158EDAD